MGFESRLKEDGSYVDSGDLEPPPADLVRPDLAAERDLPPPPADGAAVVSGYYVVEVPDAGAARAIAASAPLYGTVEVRPVVDYSAWS